MFKEGFSEAGIIANLRGEFLEDTRRRIDLLIKNKKLAETADDPAAFYGEFKQEVHTLKGMGQSFGFASVTMISRRLEYYLKDKTAESFAIDPSIGSFILALERIVDARIEPGEDELDDILDKLPAPLWSSSPLR